MLSRPSEMLFPDGDREVSARHPARDKGGEPLFKFVLLLRMKTLVVLAVLVVAFTPFGHAEGDNPEDAVLQTERELTEAYQRSDAAGIERLVMEDYTLTNSRGKITRRSDDLEEARKADPKYEIFENENMKVRVHGDCAVVLGITRAKGTSGGEPFDARFEFTDTFVRDGAQWRLWAGHVTKVSPEVQN